MGITHTDLMQNLSRRFLRERKEGHNFSYTLNPARLTVFTLISSVFPITECFFKVLKTERFFQNLDVGRPKNAESIFIRKSDS